MSRTTEQIARLLEAAGVPTEEAQRLAAEAAHAMQSAQKGETFGSIEPMQLWEVWSRAARAGARKITLEITADGADQAEALERGTVSAHIVDAEVWPDWSPEQAAEQEARAALLRREFLADVDDLTYLENDPRAGWSEVDYIANGEECPDVYAPREPAARARAEEMN